MVVPFTGTAFLGDQRRYLYMFTNETGGDPWPLLERTLDRVDFFLSLGNFRPLGRLFMVTIETMTLEAAMATGVPPHVVGGLIRLLMVGLLACTGAMVVSALWRSAKAGSGVDSELPGRSFSMVFGLMLAVSMVASGLHPVMWFPAYLVGVVALALAVPVLVVSHASLSRPWSWRLRDISGKSVSEFLAIALLGCALALVYDLVYVVPLLFAAMLVVRGALARMPWRRVLMSAAAARLIALGAGFMAVFLPVRLAIRARCAAYNCYGATDAVLSDFSVSKLFDRLATGSPPAGWRHTQALLDHDLPRNGLTEAYLTNWTTFLVLGVLGWGVWVSARAFSRGLRPMLERASSLPLRMAWAMIAVGVATALLPALLVAFSRTVQNSDWPIGAPWRETLMVQVGWAFALAGLVVLAAVWLPSRLGPRRGGWVVALVALGLFGAMLLTYYSNDQYARLLRSKPEENAVALVSASIVNFDTSEAGERARCEILRSYPRTDRFGVLDMLNELAESTYGQPFCDPDTAGGYPSGFADDDGSPHEPAIDAMHAASITLGCRDDPHRFCPDYKASRAYAVWVINRLVWIGVLEAGAADPLAASDGELTRGDMARFLVESSDALRPVAAPRGLFADLDSDLAPYAEAVYEGRVVDACSSSPLLFCPEDTVTRGELMTMVARTFGLVPR